MSMLIFLSRESLSFMTDEPDPRYNNGSINWEDLVRVKFWKKNNNLIIIFSNSHKTEKKTEGESRGGAMEYWGDT